MPDRLWLKGHVLNELQWIEWAMDCLHLTHSSRYRAVGKNDAYRTYLEIHWGLTKQHIPHDLNNLAVHVVM